MTMASEQEPVPSTEPTGKLLPTASLQAIDTTVDHERGDLFSMGLQPAVPATSVPTDDALITLMELPADVLLRVYGYLSPYGRYNFRLICQLTTQLARQHTIKFAKIKLAELYERLHCSQQTLPGLYPKLQQLDLELTHMGKAVEQLQAKLGKCIDHDTLAASSSSEPYVAAASEAAESSSICSAGHSFELPTQTEGSTVNRAQLAIPIQAGDAMGYAVRHIPPTYKALNLQQMISLPGMIGSSSSLTSMRLQFYEWDLPIALFNGILRQFTNVQKLELVGFNMCQFKLTLFSDVDLPMLSQLTINSCQISSSAIQALCCSLTALKHLDLKWVDMGKPLLIHHVPSITRVQIASSGSTAKNVAGFLKRLPNLRHYTQESFGSKGAPMDCVIAVIRHLPDCCEVLELPFCGLSVHSSHPLCIGRLQNLTRLDVEHLNISDSDTQLVSMPNMRVLRLRTVFVLATSERSCSYRRFLRAFPHLSELHVGLAASSLGHSPGAYQILLEALANVPRLYFGIHPGDIHRASAILPVLQQPNVCGLSFAHFNGFRVSFDRFMENLPGYLPIMPNVECIQLPFVYGTDEVAGLDAFKQRVMQLIEHMPSLQSLEVPSRFVRAECPLGRAIVDIAKRFEAQRLRIVLGDWVLDEVVHELNLQIDAELGTGCVVSNEPGVWLEPAS